MIRSVIIRSRDISNLRKIIRYNVNKIDKISSAYYHSNYVYIGFLINDDLCLVNAAVELIAFDGGDGPDLLINWCTSELFDSSEFIHYETQTAPVANGCIFTDNDNIILRSYRSLTEIMLIINLTPDSFSDGGKYYHNLVDILVQVKSALSNGIQIIDIGAESTRPQASVIDVAEEISRLNLVMNEITLLKASHDFRVSLDSYKPETIEYFFEQIDIVNDVSNKLPLELIKKITNSGKKYILMHSLTIPADPSINIDSNVDVTTEIVNWFKSRLSVFKSSQIDLSHIIIDPGIGFNKTTAQSWQILRNVERFYELGCEVLIGHSRKRFMSSITNSSFDNRDIETAVISNYLLSKNIDYVRMHEYKDLFIFNNITNNLGVH